MRLRENLVAGLQLALRRGVEELLVGNRVPQIQGESRSDIVSVGCFSIGEFRVKEARRFERKKNDPLDRDLGALRRLKLTLDEALIFLVAQRTTKCRLGKFSRELLELVAAIGRVRFASRELVEVIFDMLGDI